MFPPQKGGGEGTRILLLPLQPQNSHPSSYSTLQPQIMIKVRENSCSNLGWALGASHRRHRPGGAICCSHPTPVSKHITRCLTDTCCTPSPRPTISLHNSQHPLTHTASPRWICTHDTHHGIALVHTHTELHTARPPTLTQIQHTGTKVCTETRAH